MVRRTIGWITVGVVSLGLVLGLGRPELYSLVTFAQSQTNPTPNPGCSPNVVPVGQANPPGEPEPMAPVWCFNLTSQQPTTFTAGANDWVDDFQTNVQMGRLNDGDLGYRIFDNINTKSSTARTQHFINNNHWMDDNAGGFQGGAMLRPNRSFTFENGKLVVEADVAAGIPDYQGFVWPEITISMAPQPTSNIVDSLYAYGHFGGFWTVGCRLHPMGNPICSVENAASDVTNTDNRVPCFRSAPARVMEVSDFEACGSMRFGGNRANGRDQLWRVCKSNQMDMFCRDRFRLEITKTSLMMYVNGGLYFVDGNWPSQAQLPDSMVNGGQVYAYFSDWQVSPTAPAYRFHWGRLAINPHNRDGSPAAPSASPSYCPGMPQTACMDGIMPMPMDPSTPTPTTRTPTATRTAAPHAGVSKPTTTPTPPTNRDSKGTTEQVSATHTPEPFHTHP